jgi:hypothetical protein
MYAFLIYTTLYMQMLCRLSLVKSSARRQCHLSACRLASSGADSEAFTKVPLYQLIRDVQNEKVVEISARMDKADTNMAALTEAVKTLGVVLNARLDQQDTRLNARLDQQDTRLNARLDQLQQDVSKMPVQAASIAVAVFASLATLATWFGVGVQVTH